MYRPRASRGLIAWVDSFLWSDDMPPQATPLPDVGLNQIRPDHRLDKAGLGLRASAGEPKRDYSGGDSKRRDRLLQP